MIDRETIQSIAAQVPNNPEAETPTSARSKSFLNVQDNETESTQAIEKQNPDVADDNAINNQAFDAEEPTIETRKV